MSGIEQLIASGVRGLQPYQPGKPAETLERELGIKEIIKLASNENPRGASPLVADAVGKVLSGVARYPDGSGHSLKQALSERLDVSPEQITLGNGSNDVLDLIARAFVDPGQEVVVSEHAFAVYLLAAKSVNARLVTVPAREFGHDLDSMAKAVTDRTRVVFMANPNNPTGTHLGFEAVERFLLAMPPSVITVLDEAYFEYVNEADYPDGTVLLSRFPKLVITRTFSKAYGLAGLRVGYAIASEAITEVLNRVRHPFNVNSLALAAAEAALADDDFVSDSVLENRKGLEQLGSGFARLGLGWIPSVANFICVHVGPHAAGIYQSMLQQGVIVRPVANYGLPEHLRITVGLDHENARALEAMEIALTESGRS
ncbi:MAG: histidinol-phosphate transaminase [Arenicellales bacterium]|jgi:histidinol-phosphate aminotransferase|nr:histidinol-phosphate transaminase [Arenicellales bacterium]MDP6551503.1 histidinol-phosphate transaminase [Arenicellales bacterium]MDP6790983.1 histidinol-phosphate transaminase [Arenicellales bacterium]MDP6918529.1 histidinol-phosphate transaminase [Arenicellales bacterium]|tara:strand:+ start:5111 stop:6223 length:1113 start_codon:yes stop_codon:yes gene_type:complete